MSKLAIDGGAPVRTKPWPTWPVFGDAERSRLLEVFESGKWWYGDRVAEFEAAFASFQDATYGISCTSGTTALEAALVGLGIGAGDEVIVPPYTFVATASAVLRSGAEPVFADVELETLNIDPAATEKAITPRTRAIIPVHFAGLPCDMDRLLLIAREHKIAILEDACHSWGSKWRGKGTGAIGDCGAFSFQMSKNITAGEGGIVLTDNEELADLIRSFTNVGRAREGAWYQHVRLGSNLRLTELQAAILLGQITRLEEQTAKRQANAEHLNATIDRLPGIYRQSTDERADRRSYHLYTMRLDEEETGISRARFVAALSAEGVSCSVGYPHPLYRNEVFTRRTQSGSICPNAEVLSRQVVWLTQPMLLAEIQDMDDIGRAIEKVLDHGSELH